MDNNASSIVKISLSKNNKLSKSPNIPEMIYFISGTGKITVNEKVLSFSSNSFIAISPKSTYLIEAENADLFVLPINDQDDSYVFNTMFYDSESSLFEALEIAYMNYYSGHNDSYYQLISSECYNIIHLNLLDIFGSANQIKEQTL